MRAKLRTPTAKAWLGFALGAALLVSTAACGPGGGTDGALPNSTSSNTDASTQDAEPSPTAETSVSDDAEECSGVSGAATIPAQFTDLGVPFYPCTQEVAVVSDTDTSFVGEYVTSDETIIVEMSLTNQFDASDWAVSARTVDGDNAITMAAKAGYALVVAIGPTLNDPTTTSIHYTLRAE